MQLQPSSLCNSSFQNQLGILTVLSLRKDKKIIHSKGTLLYLNPTPFTLIVTHTLFI